MPSTYSPTLRTELPATGELNEAWAPVVNNNWSVPIEQGLTQVVTIPMPNADYTLTTANAATDQARAPVLVFTGALTADRKVIAPSVPKVYIIRNNTTGGRNLVFTTAAPTTPVSDIGYPVPMGAAPYADGVTTALPPAGVRIPAGATAHIWTDGTNFQFCEDSLGGDVLADSYTPTTPMAAQFGGTAANTASAARAYLAVGNAAVLNASTGASENTVAQRDGSGSFAANVITAGLNGTAASATNTALFQGLSPAVFMQVGTNPSFQTLPISAGNPMDVDIYSAYGPGVYHVWWRTILDFGQHYTTIVVADIPYTLQLNNTSFPEFGAFYARGFQMTSNGVASPGSTAGAMFGFAKTTLTQ